MYIWLGHFAVQQKLEEGCKSTCTLIKKFFLKKKTTSRGKKMFVPMSVKPWEQGHSDTQEGREQVTCKAIYPELERWT